jgi:hypothetical protein
MTRAEATHAVIHPTSTPQLVALDDTHGFLLDGVGGVPVRVGTLTIYDVRAVRSTVHMNRYLDRQARDRQGAA